MSDDRHHHDYKDFFKPDQRQAPEENQGSAGEETKTATEQGMNYYNYGPYRSQPPESRPSVSGQTTYASGQGTPSSVDVYTPKPPVLGDHGQGSSAGGSKSWSYPSKPKKSFKSYVATFLVGVLVMGSFMFAADHNNWFTGDQALAGADQVSGQVSKGSSSNSGGEATYASFEVVRPNNIADIVDQASPAVVKIETMATASSSRRSPMSNDDFFRYFFGDQYPQPQDQRKQVSGMGSGFIFDSEGYILTNEHVVADADEIYVTLFGHKEKYKAELLGSDFDLDLAVLKIEGDTFPTLPIGDSSKLRVGDWVTAIGNPIGFDHTVSVGVLSAKEREIDIPDTHDGYQDMREYKHLLQTDASINPGNSGGPLLNLNGEVIGINTAVSSDAQGIGFAIPTSTILEVLEPLKKDQNLPRPYIGIAMTDIDERWLGDLKLESTDGVLITQIETPSPASRAGLEPYDVIVKMDGEAVKNAEALKDKVTGFKVNQKVELTIIRNGKTFETAIMIGDRNAD